MCLFVKGAWENQGLGIVKNLGDGLVWTYTASHLGFWLAAPLPSISGMNINFPFANLMSH